jgi:hypothetical protein
MNQTTSYDYKLRIIPNLTWLPWVCAGYFQRPKDKRVLVVGESHYIRPESPDQFDDQLISLIGVQHLGKYFSWEKWNDYLVRQHPDLMGFLHAEKYTNNS